MSEPSSSGYGQSPATGDPDADLVDGTPGHDRGDGGTKDDVLVTDDAAQREDDVARPGNA